MLESANLSSASYEPSSYESAGAMEGSEQLVEGYISSPELTQSARRFRSIKQQPMMMMAGLGVAVVLGLLLGVGTSFLFKGKGGQNPLPTKADFKDFKLADPTCTKDEVDTMYGILAAKKLATFYYTGVRAGEEGKKPEEFNPATLLQNTEVFISTTHENMATLVATQGRSKPATVDDKASAKFEDLAAKLGEAAKLRDTFIMVNDWKAKVDDLVTKRNAALTGVLGLVDAATNPKLQAIIDFSKAFTTAAVADLPKEGDDAHKTILEAVKTQVDANQAASDDQKNAMKEVVASFDLVHKEAKELHEFITKVGGSFEALKKPFSS